MHFSTLSSAWLSAAPYSSTTSRSPFTHVIRTYGGAPVPGGIGVGSIVALANSSRARLPGRASREDPTVAELARECGLSSGYFARAFRQTTGVTPHRGSSKKMERARGLLLGNGHALADIALVSGFVDQSHFTESLRSSKVTAPGRWRRSTANLTGDRDGSDCPLRRIRFSTKGESRTSNQTIRAWLILGLETRRFECRMSARRGGHGQTGFHRASCPPGTRRCLRPRLRGSGLPLCSCTASPTISAFMMTWSPT